MASTYTTGKARLEKPANNDQVNAWDVPVNANMDAVDACISANTTIGLSSADVSMTASQMKNQTLVLTGTLTANVNLKLLSTVGGFFVVKNSTSGAFSVTVKTTAVGSTGVPVAQNYAQAVYSDGTNVYYADDGTSIPANNSVTNAKLAQMAANTVKGNLTASTANASDNTLSAFAIAMRAYIPYIGGAQGLVIVNGATGNTQISVTATSALLPVTSSLVASQVPVIKVSSVNVTINTGSTGANGRDTGSLATGWWNVYIISNGTTTAGLMSTSSTAPTLPSGYNWFLRVGAMRVNSSLQLLRTRQRGDHAQYVVTTGTNTASLPTLANGTSGNIFTPTWTAFSTSTFVPPTAKRIHGSAGAINGAIIFAPNNDYGAEGSTTSAAPIDLATGGSGPTLSALFDFVLEETNVYYASNSANGYVNVLGWTDAVIAS